MSEIEVQILRTEFQGLKELLTDRFDQTKKHGEDLFKQTEKHVDEKFKQIGKQLEEEKSLSKGTGALLRGNNERPGKNGRLYSLETLKLFLCGQLE